MKSRKHKKVFTTLNYIEHFFILASVIMGCISISAFASLLGIPIGITSSPGDELYVNWKGYDSSFDSWIQKENQYK